jgi:hypothetical protein
MGCHAQIFAVGAPNRPFGSAVAAAVLSIEYVIEIKRTAAYGSIVLKNSTGEILWQYSFAT